MRFYSLLLCLLISGWSSYGQSKNGYRYTVDLTKVVDDRLYVELSTPPVKSDTITFYLPKIVPGTYAIADYGRYVTELKATDKKGKSLTVEKVNENAWKISNAKKLAKISYWVDDTWDTTVTGPDIFWPAGTNIDESKNYVLNTSGFFGYLQGQKDVPFQLNIVRSKDLYGSTGLIPEASGAPVNKLKLENIENEKDKVVDVYRSEDYDELIDSPLMYSKPDTAIIKVANTEVLIGSYSPNNVITADQIAESIERILVAQTAYLGGKLPVDKYAFIFYWTDKPVLSYGALEHSYSSFYYIPEMPIAQIEEQLRHFAAHEFFHIVTPLTIHSEEIDKFDFNDPKMSQHLWMYEGVTEYFSFHAQVQHGLMTREEFLNEFRDKLNVADQFINDVAFTDISKFTLDKYHDQYYNVYQKGALIALCLDIKLRKLSGGKYGLRNLMLDLSNKFGKNKAFKDDELFSIITEMTYPEIGEFFNKYVKGTEPLPIKEVFTDVGISYIPEEKFADYSMGLSNSALGITEIEGKPMLQVSSSDNLNGMGKALGFQTGDVIVAINEEKAPDLGPDFGAFLQKHTQALAATDTLSYGVLRKDEKGEYKEVKLSAPVTKIEQVRKHSFEPNPDATAEQKALRDSWLKP